MIEMKIYNDRDSFGASIYKLMPSAIKIGNEDAHFVDNLKFELPTEWTGLTVRATFIPNKYKAEPVAMIVPDNGVIIINSNITDGDGIIVVDAFADNLHYYTTNSKYAVANHKALKGIEPIYTPTQIEQILANVQSIANTSIEARDKAEEYAEQTQADREEIEEIKTEIDVIKIDFDEKKADFDSKLIDFGINYEEKVEEFNQNARSKTTKFDQNATSKQNQFNSNATSKQNDFDANALLKRDWLDSQAQGIAEQYERDAERLTDEFNSNASAKITGFNNLVADKKTEIVDLAEEKKAEISALVPDISMKMEKHLLSYDGTHIIDNGANLDFNRLYNILMTSPDFAVLVYQNYAYHPNGVSTEQIVFSASYPVNGMDANHRITMLKNGTVTKTDATDENVINKVSAITELNKADEKKYTSVKAVTDYVQPTKDALAEAKEKIVALETELARNKEIDDARWKMAEGIVYDFVEDDVSGDKVVPNGAKNMSLEMLGGMARKGNNKLNGKLFNNPFPNGAYGLTFSFDGETLVLNGTASSTIAFYIIGNSISGTTNNVILESGKTYTFVHTTYNGFSATFVYNGANVASSGNSFVYSAIHGLRCQISNGTVFNNTRISFMLNEGTTALPYEPYTDSLIDAKVESVESVGINLWDEEWEVGTIEWQTGLPSARDTSIRPKNFISVDENVSYFVSLPYEKNIFYYGYDYSLIHREYKHSSVQTFVTPQNTKYVKIAPYPSYGNVYKNNIAVIKGTSGTYKSYFKTTTEIPQAIQQLDGYGIGINADCYNYFERVDDKVLWHKRVGSVDLGSLSWEKVGWNANDWASKSIADIKYVANNTQIGNALAQFYTIRQGAGDSSATVGQFAVDTSQISVFSGDDMPIGYLYYELAEEIITDVTDLFTEDLDNITVESGGTVSFIYPQKDTYSIDVPNRVEYLRKLSEVAE